MRNMVEFPVTYQEAMAFLEMLAEQRRQDLTDAPIGDPSLVIIEYIQEQLWQYNDLRES